MKYFIVLILSVAASSEEVFSWFRHKSQLGQNFSVANSNRIVNGKIASPGQFPHQVLLEVLVGFQLGRCGGSIICDSWVLTAAHCTPDGTDLITVYIGSVKFGEGRVIKETKEYYAHPEYNHCNSNNDISLIRLPEKLVYDEFIQPIPLNTEYINGQNPVTLSGWGDTSKCGIDTVPLILNYADMVTITNEECKEHFSSYVISNEILCVKGLMKESGCNGDSGGPLIEYRDGKALQLGVVSLGSITCDNGFPVTYARVSSYIDWILKTINGTCELPQ